MLLSVSFLISTSGRLQVTSFIQNQVFPDLLSVLKSLLNLDVALIAGMVSKYHMRVVK